MLGIIRSSSSEIGIIFYLSFDFILNIIILFINLEAFITND